MNDTTNNSDSTKTILVVEDDAFLQDLLSKKLSKEKGSVTAYYATTGEKALEMAKEIDPTLIVLDLILPGIDGFEVLERLREDDQTADIPVVVLSNLGQEEYIKRAENYGVEDFMVKANMNLDAIIQKIKQYSE